jgi:arginyl-tRNA synthetase
MSIAQLTEEQAIAFYHSNKWQAWDAKTRAVFQLQQNKVCMPANVFRQAVSEALSRPIEMQDIYLDRHVMLQELQQSATTIFSCWNGSFYELFSARAAAESRAESVLKDFQDQGHPLGFASVSEMVTEGAVKYSLTPAHIETKIVMNQVRETYFYPSESPGCSAGDDSPEVAAAVANWWRERNMALSAAA